MTDELQTIDTVANTVSITSVKSCNACQSLLLTSPWRLCDTRINIAMYKVKKLSPKM